MNDLICISSIVIAIKLSDRTPNSWMWITKSITCSKLLTRTIWSINAKQRSHVKFGLLWLDCDSQIRTKLANLWGIFDPILKNGLFDARSFRFKKESFWSQELSPWCDASSLCYGSRFSTRRFQSKQLILGRMQCDMSFVAHGCCCTSTLKSHIIGSQCQPFGKLHDSKIYSIYYLNVNASISIY
jgi:hypothetical protein